MEEKFSASASYRWGAILIALVAWSVLIGIGMWGVLKPPIRSSNMVVLVSDDNFRAGEVYSWCEGGAEACAYANFGNDLIEREVIYIKPQGREELEPIFNIPAGFVAVYTDVSDEARIREYIYWGPTQRSLVPGAMRLTFYRQGTYLLLRKDNPVSSTLH